MTTRSGTPYHPIQGLSSVAINSNFETMMKPMTEQMARLNQNMTDQLAQMNQGTDRFHDDQTLRITRLEAPTFDGDPNPKVYYDWEGEMDQCFERFDMTEKTKFEFARFKLIRQAILYWRNVEKQIEHRGEVPVTTWEEMKFMLREKYFPLSYHLRILDQWSRLTQGTKSVTEYITKFNEVVKRCLVDEPEIDHI